MAYAAASEEAPLRPNPQLSGRADSTATWKSRSLSRLARVATVGKRISSPLKVTAVREDSETVTSAPSVTVKLSPRECIFSGSSSAMILKRPEMLPGAKAVADLMKGGLRGSLYWTRIGWVSLRFAAGRPADQFPALTPGPRR